MTRPAEHRRYAVSALPVSVFLTAEWCHRCVRPAVHVRTVVGGVHDESVVHHALIIQCFEDGADILVVVDHGVVVWALPAAGLTNALQLGVGAEVHVRKVHPDEGWLAGLVLPLNEFHRPSSDVIVDRFHSLPGQRTGVLANLFADLAETRVHRRIVRGGSLAVQHSAGTKLGAERRILRIVGIFRLFFGVEVV